VAAKADTAMVAAAARRQRWRIGAPEYRGVCCTPW
jgi:hypothetical protein